jgi:hypothetical protein
MVNKRNAFVGWLVLTIGKPLAKRKAKKAKRVGKREGIIAGAVAATGAALAGLMFWRKRKGGEESPQS